MKGKLTIGVIAILAIALIAGMIKFYYVFGDGVKAGELNYFTHKGYIFKTYEGRLIMNGYTNKTNTDGTSGFQSNEFTFSVEKESVAEQLMRCSGKQVELHYREYLGTLPWRGISVYVVDSVISVSNAATQQIVPVQ